MFFTIPLTDLRWRISKSEIGYPQSRFLLLAFPICNEGLICSLKFIPKNVIFSLRCMCLIKVFIHYYYLFFSLKISLFIDILEPFKSTEKMSSFRCNILCLSWAHWACWKIMTYQLVVNNPKVFQAKKLQISYSGAQIIP